MIKEWKFVMESPEFLCNNFSVDILSFKSEIMFMFGVRDMCPLQAVVGMACDKTENPSFYI